MHALNMVSCLTVPTKTTASPSSRTHIRSRKTGCAENDGRAVEIDLHPDHYAHVGLDNVALNCAKRNQCSDGVDLECVSDDARNTLRRAPSIDSEILSQGITRASPLQKDPTMIITPASANEPLSVATNINEQAKHGGRLGPTVMSQDSNYVANTTIKEKANRSSTMPGFIKNENLDTHIFQNDLRSLTSPIARKHLRRSKSDAEAGRLQRRAVNTATMYAKSAAVPDSLIPYTKEIHTIERITPREEKNLGTRTQEAMRLQRLRDDLQARHGREPTDAEWCAASGKLNVLALDEAIRDGTRAKNHLVASNLRMVQRVVNMYIRNGLGSEYDAGDLMQDGTMALIRAAEKYEPDRGFRFSTYAMYWIRSAVKRSQTSQSRIINVPQRLHETHKRITKNYTRLRKELGHEPSKEQLAKASDISVLQLDRCVKAMSQRTFSLDAEVKNAHKPSTPQSRKDTLGDIVKEHVDETEYEQTQRLLMKEHLINTIRQYLLPHEVDLLLLRYGLMDERALPKGMSGPLTIANISRLVGLKPDKVRRIIINSQKQLKHLMKEWEDFEYEPA